MRRYLNQSGEDTAFHAVARRKRFGKDVQNLIPFYEIDSLVNNILAIHR